MIKKSLKLMGLTVGIVVSAIILVVVLFIHLSPVFGGTITAKQRTIYARSENFENGKFSNSESVNLKMSLTDMRKMMVAYFIPPPQTVPKKDISTEKVDSLDIVRFRDHTRLIWFGHSTFLLQISNKNILIDPMFGPVPAPHPMLGGSRFSKELPIEVEKLPSIDAVIISHDHYDHLDYISIKKLKDKVATFYVPLGVGAHLQRWNIEKERIKELDWWDEITHDDLIFRCTPAKHFSGRAINDRYKTLWCSWIIESASENIFFSGDSGFGTHFKDIGNRYGPFDFAMLECGQYNVLWPDVHMFPEETAQAGVDLGARQIMPIHWGAFKLSTHPWTESVKRLLKKSQELNIDVIIPKIGESRILGDSAYKQESWWEQYL